MMKRAIPRKRFLDAIVPSLRFLRIAPVLGMIIGPALPERLFGAGEEAVPRSVAAAPLLAANTPTATPTPPIATSIVMYASDAFNRTVSGAWGAADVGGAWTTSSGSATDYNVSPGAGTISEPAGGSSRLAELADVSARDVDVKFQVEINQLATGGSQYAYAVVRRAQGGTER